MSNQNKKIVGRECRHVLHVPTKSGEIPDVHIIKEVLHYEGGEIERRIRLVKDYKRPFYITRPQFRNHQQAKEWEDLDKLMRYECTQSELRIRLARALGRMSSYENVKKLSENPYVYGTEISSAALIKNEYLEAYPNYRTPSTTATFDVETDVVRGDGDILMATMVYDDLIHTVIDPKYAVGVPNLVERVLRKAEQLLSEEALAPVSKALNEKDADGNLRMRSVKDFELKVEIGDDQLDMLKRIFAMAHVKKPDFVAIWNIDYDIPQVLAAIKKYGGDPRDILCDPSIPREFQICNYLQGNKKQVTASGKVKPKNPSIQWHTLDLSASFYVIDAMCSYRHIRLGSAEEPSYGLDALTTKHLKKGKLHHPAADQYTGLRWHQVMQRDHKVEYVVYNQYDSLGMKFLDYKTKDLAYRLPGFSGMSEYRDFKSQPKRIADAFYFFLLENYGKVLGTAPPSELAADIDDDNIPDDEDAEEEESEFDEEAAAQRELDRSCKTLGLNGWIVTLPAHNQVLGLKIIRENPHMQTGVRAFVYDSDAVGAYPSATEVANVSRTTTVFEISSIDGVEESMFRMQGINLVQGYTNALEYTTEMFGAPTMFELLDSLVA